MNSQTLHSTTLVQRVQAILHDSGQEPTKIAIRSFVNSDVSYYVIVVDRISSTMLLSEKWDWELSSPTTVFIFVAKFQSAGRGQRENKWESPQGNISMTVLCSFSNFEIMPYQSIIAVLSAAEAIQKLTDIRPQLKWINDIFIGDKKVGGVLVKNNIIGNRCYVQIGIGINVATSPIQSATCLSQQLKKTNQQQNQQLLDMLIDQIAIKLIHKIQLHQIPVLMRDYEQRLMYLGRQVVVMDIKLENIVEKGIFVGISAHGFAIIQTIDGSKVEVSCGRMRGQQIA